MPTKTKEKAEDVVKKLRREIISGRLEPGKTLRQEALAARYAVSRQPVRDGLWQLQDEGLVVYQHNHGFQVSELLPEDIEDIYDMRIALESLAVRLVVPALREIHLRTMENRLQEADEALSLKTWREKDHEFHQVLFWVLKRPRLKTQIDRLRNNASRYLALDSSIMKMRDKLQKEHWLIYEACKKGDMAGVRSLLTQHLDEERGRLVSCLNHQSP